MLPLKLMLMGSDTSGEMSARTWTAQRVAKEMVVRTCMIRFAELLDCFVYDYLEKVDMVLTVSHQDMSVWMEIVSS